MNIRKRLNKRIQSKFTDYYKFPLIVRIARKALNILKCNLQANFLKKSQANVIISSDIKTVINIKRQPRYIVSGRAIGKL